MGCGCRVCGVRVGWRCGPASGGWEEEWCRKCGLKGPFETVDLKGFFDLSRVEREDVLTQRRRGAEYAEMFGRVEHVERVEGESVSQGAPSLRDGAKKSEYSHQ